RQFIRKEISLLKPESFLFAVSHVLKRAPGCCTIKLSSRPVKKERHEELNTEELTRMKEENASLQEQLNEQKRAINEVEAEIKSLQSNLTLEEIQAKEERLTTEERLVKLRDGVTLVKLEEQKAIQELYTQATNHWRKRIFKDLRDAITVNSQKDVKEFKEELGVEYDEDFGVNLQSFLDLLHTAISERGRSVDGTGANSVRNKAELRAESAPVDKIHSHLLAELAAVWTNSFEFPTEFPIVASFFYSFVFL
ncbi:LOW QUALITY PROTEIN: hypothetical protein V2J09_021199, partial [Rumex salicifolius]